MFREDAGNPRQLSMNGVGGFDSIHGGALPTEVWTEYMLQAMKGVTPESFPLTTPIGQRFDQEGMPTPTPTPTPSEKPSEKPSQSPSQSAPRPTLRARPRRTAAPLGSELPEQRRGLATAGAMEMAAVPVVVPAAAPEARVRRLGRRIRQTVEAGSAARLADRFT